MPPPNPKYRTNKRTGEVQEFLDGAWKTIKQGVAGAMAPVVEAIGSAAVKDAPLRPADAADLASKRNQRQDAQSRVRSGDIFHAPMPDHEAQSERALVYQGNGQYGVARTPVAPVVSEMNRARTEEAPVTRTRTGQPQMESTHPLSERVVAAIAPHVAAALHGATAAGAGLTNIPIRAVAPQAQAQVEQLAGSSPLLPVVATTAAMAPSSIGSRAGAAAAGILPPVAEGAGMVMRGIRGLGQALLGGLGAGAVQSGSDAVANMQRGMPATQALSQVPGQVVNSTMMAGALAPLVMGIPALGRTAATRLRQAPGMEDLVALENAGLTTKVPYPGSGGAVQNEATQVVRGEPPSKLPFSRGPKLVVPAEGNAIAAAQREQAGTGEPAQDINVRRAGRAIISDLDARRKAALAQSARESTAYEDTPEGQQKVSTQPVVDYILGEFRGAHDANGRPLPGAKSFANRVSGNYGQFIEGRIAGPGEEGGIPLSEARRLGIEVGMPAQTEQRPLPPRSPEDSPTVPSPPNPDPSKAPPLDIPPPPRLPHDAPVIDENGGIRANATIPEIQRDLGVPHARAVEIRAELDRRFPPGKPTRMPEPVADERQTMRAPPPSEPGDPMVVLGPRHLNARELEYSRGLFDEEAGVSRDVAKRSSESESDLGVANTLRSLRQGFAPNDATVDPATGQQMVRQVAGREQAGYPALKQSQHERLTALENEFKAAGINIKTARLSPDDVGQLDAAMNRIRSSGTTLERLMPGASPEAKRAMRVAAAHVAYDRLRGQSPTVHPSATSIAGGSPTRTVMSWHGGMRLALDPLMRGVGGSDLPRGSGAVRNAGQTGGAASQVDPEMLRRYLGAIGLGDQEDSGGQQ